MIKYIGSKRTLLPHITAAFSDLSQGASVLDLFTGTTRVAQGLKSMGLNVHANDHNSYAWVNARCYVAGDRDLLADRAEELLDTLRDTPPAPGWFTEHYSHQARFFHPDNGARIEAIRNRIEKLDLDPALQSVALVSLMEAADRVDSTTGVQMAFLKEWAARASKPLELRMPRLLPGGGTATCQEALTIAETFSGDAAYLDPPYNQHNYRANYHVWETLIQWDNPEVYGVVHKRMDCRELKSDFNSKRRIEAAFQSVVGALDVPRLVVSFNNEGFLGREQIESILGKRGHVATVELDHKRYVGAQIGIYNLEGRAVGQVGHLRNKELLYIMDVDPDRADAAAVRAAGAVDGAISR